MSDNSTGIDADPMNLSTPAVVAQMGFSIFLTIALFSLFIPVFFFYQAASVEKTVVKESLKDLVNEFSKEFQFMLTPNQSAQVGAVLSTMQMPDMSADDSEVASMNSKLKKKAWMVLGTGTLIIFACIAIIYAAMRYRVTSKGLNPSVALPNIPHLAFSVAVCFASVIGIEFLFLFVVARQFKPLDTNAVKFSFINTLIDIGNPSKKPAAVPSIAPSIT